MKNILITGASSGMGAALARGYAGPGRTIAIVGRSSERLASVAAELSAKSAACVVGQVDVTDGVALKSFVENFDSAHPVDLLIVNAGIFDGRKPGQDIEDLETSLRVIDTNLNGALNTLHAALPGMRRRGSGHIVFVSSLAGMTPLGGGLGYSASKSAIIAYALGLKQLLHHTGIRVTVVCPGFVETPITARHLGWQPLRMSADRAARKIMRGVAGNRAIVAFPFLLHLIARPSIMVPDVVRRIVGGFFACHAAPARGDETGVKVAGVPAE